MYMYLCLHIGACVGHQQVGSSHTCNNITVVVVCVRRSSTTNNRLAPLLVYMYYDGGVEGGMSELICVLTHCTHERNIHRSQVVVQKISWRGLCCITSLWALVCCARSVHVWVGY